MRIGQVGRETARVVVSSIFHLFVFIIFNSQTIFVFSTHVLFFIVIVDNYLHWSSQCFLLLFDSREL